MNIKHALVMLMAATVLYSCGDGFKKTDDGLEYKIHTKNDGDKIKKEDYVTLHMVYRTSTDSVLFNTYVIGQPIRLIIDEPTYKGDIMSAIMLLTKGDSATFKINADSLFALTFGVDRPPFIEAGSNLTFEIKIEDVKTKAMIDQEFADYSKKQMELEKDILAKFIEEKKYKDVFTTETGLRLVAVTNPANTNFPLVGDTVVVHYTGRLLDGTKFDSSYDRNQPITFVLRQGQVIDGWFQGLQLLKKGQKSVLIIPSPLAYGEQGASGTIPPNSPLVFDVELVDIKKAQ